MNTIIIIHREILALKNSHLPTYTLHLHYLVIILSMADISTYIYMYKKRDDFSVYCLHILACVTSVLICNFTTVPECNRKCQEGFGEVRHISVTSVPDIHQGPVNKLYLMLSEHNSLFFFALQIICGKTTRWRLERCFSTPLIMRSNAAWLSPHVNSSGFPLETHPLQIKLTAMQSNQWSEARISPEGSF